MGAEDDSPYASEPTLFSLSGVNTALGLGALELHIARALELDAGRVAVTEAAERSGGCWSSVLSLRCSQGVPGFQTSGGHLPRTLKTP